VFTDHLYPAAKSYIEDLFRWHMKKIFEFAPDAIHYLEKTIPGCGTYVPFQSLANVIT
jgi:hypothetical protein